jgi:hypothetical protein
MSDPLAGNPLAILPHLLKAGGITEAYHVTCYRCFKGDEEITVEVCDRGEGHDTRYHVKAKKAGRTTAGYSNESILDALKTIRWQDLD